MRNWARKISEKKTFRKGAELRFDGLDVATTDICVQKLRWLSGRTRKTIMKKLHDHACD